MVAGCRLLLLLALATGCNRSEKSATQQNAEQLRAAIAAETGDTNTLLLIDRDDIRIRSGEQTLRVNQTESPERPADLPEDIVLPGDARTDLWTEGPRGRTLSLLTDLPPGSLAEFFREEWTARAWQTASDVEVDPARCLVFRKDDRLVSIRIEPETERAPTTRALLFIEAGDNESETP